jgi:hypothetical protein
MATTLFTMLIVSDVVIIAVLPGHVSGMVCRGVASGLVRVVGFPRERFGA